MQSFALALAIKRTSTKRKYTITQVTTTYNNTLVKKNMQKHKKNLNHRAIEHKIQANMSVSYDCAQLQFRIV